MPAKVDVESVPAASPADACPSEAIKMERGKAKIDANMDCGVCVDECPVEAKYGVIPAVPCQ
jgi:NAD-dependent dihydropyrimidine dehydrogenase PreA subunit